MTMKLIRWKNILFRGRINQEIVRRQKSIIRKKRERSYSPYPDPFPSILKEGRFSATIKASNKSATTTTKRTPYYHNNKRKVIKASIVLSGVDKYMEFTMGVRLLFTNLQVVDKHIGFKPVNPRNIPLLKPADIPFCHT